MIQQTNEVLIKYLKNPHSYTKLSFFNNIHSNAILNIDTCSSLYLLEPFFLLYR